MTKALTMSHAGRDTIAACLGMLLIAGTYVDLRHHFRLDGHDETFFTPEHALLYSGFGLLAAWIVWVAYRSSGGRPTRATVPPGYGVGLVGVAIAFVGGVGDTTSHVIFGVEKGLNTLTTPTHLILCTGWVIMLTTPIRAQGLLRTGSNGTWTIAARVALAQAVAQVMFLIPYVTMFTHPGPVRPLTLGVGLGTGDGGGNGWAITSLLTCMVTTVLITIPLVLMLRTSRRLPLGGPTMLIISVGALPVIAVNPRLVPAAGVCGALCAAVLWELAMRRIQPRLSLAAAAWGIPASFAFVAILGQYAGLVASAGIHWPFTVWSGVPVIAAWFAGVIGFAAYAGVREPERDKASVVV